MIMLTSVCVETQILSEIHRSVCTHSETHNKASMVTDWQLKKKLILSADYNR